MSVKECRSCGHWHLDIHWRSDSYLSWGMCILDGQVGYKREDGHPCEAWVERKAFKKCKDCLSWHREGSPTGIGRGVWGKCYSAPGEYSRETSEACGMFRGRSLAKED